MRSLRLVVHVRSLRRCSRFKDSLGARGKNEILNWEVGDQNPRTN